MFFLPLEISKFAQEKILQGPCRIALSGIQLFSGYCMQHAQLVISLFYGFSCTEEHYIVFCCTVCLNYVDGSEPCPRKLLGVLMLKWRISKFGLTTLHVC